MTPWKQKMFHVECYIVIENGKHVLVRRTDESPPASAHCSLPAGAAADSLERWKLHGAGHVHQRGEDTQRMMYFLELLSFWVSYRYEKSVDILKVSKT